MHLYLPIIASAVFEATFIVLAAAIARDQKAKYEVAQSFYMRQRNNG
jgi:hypothetical protein